MILALSLLILNGSLFTDSHWHIFSFLQITDDESYKMNWTSNKQAKVVLTSTDEASPLKKAER
jgi:hypothetical protein